MPEHRILVEGERHAVFRKTWANAAARLADAGPYVTAEIGALGLQLDNGQSYRLAQVSPISWVPFPLADGMPVSHVPDSYAPTTATVAGHLAGIDAVLGELGGDVTALEEIQNQVQVASTFSALPDPASLPDGTIAAVLVASANGLPTFALVRGGEWVVTLQAFPPTITFVVRIGGGAGELPENVVVPAGATVALGTGWALEPAQSFARPSGIATLPINPASITLGPNGAGLWRFLAQVNIDSPSPSAAVLTQLMLQADVGAGFVDLPGGEMARLDQNAPAPVTGITLVGLALNHSLPVGAKLRVAIRHDAGSSRTYVVHAYMFAGNQITAIST